MYTIKYANGNTTEINSIEEAEELFGPDAIIEECGDRYLVWESEEDAENDPGHNAVAEIRDAD